MNKVVVGIAAVLALLGVSTGLCGQEQAEISLSRFEPEHYRYYQAELCVNCHQTANDVMTRAVGVDISSGSPELDARGWLASVHARSQSHGDRVNRRVRGVMPQPLIESRATHSRQSQSKRARGKA